MSFRTVVEEKASVTIHFVRGVAPYGKVAAVPTGLKRAVSREDLLPVSRETPRK